MSVWRRKWRFFSYLHFSERADATLLAVVIIQSSVDGAGFSRNDEGPKGILWDGRELSEKVDEVVHTPDRADDYTIAVVQKLCEFWQVIPEDIVDRLSGDIETLQTTEQNLVPVLRLERVKEAFVNLKEIAGPSFGVEAQQMQTGPRVV